MPLSSVRTRCLPLAPLALLAVVLAACSPPVIGTGPASTSFDGDPCLLQQYQGRGSGILSHMQGAYGTLSGRVDALQLPAETISTGQDITETLLAITEFQTTIRAQIAQMERSAMPPEGAPFRRDVGAAAPYLQTGALLLTETYTAFQNGDTRAAGIIAAAARRSLRQGRALLDAAGEQLSQLKTYSVNC